MSRIDLIIDALESAHHTNNTGVMCLTKSRIDVALAAARELKALKPVAWMGQGGDASRSANYFKEMGFTNLIELYALDDEMKHD